MKVHQPIPAIASAAAVLLGPPSVLFAEATNVFFNAPTPEDQSLSPRFPHPAVVTGGAGLRGEQQPDELPDRAAAVHRPNQSEASPDDCVIVAIAGTRHPEANQQQQQQPIRDNSHRNLQQLFHHQEDDEGESFVCEYSDGTTVPLLLDRDQLTELRQWLNGILPVGAAGGLFRSGEQTISKEGSSVGPDGAIRPPPGVPMSSLVRQDNGRGRGPGGRRRLRAKQGAQRRTAEVVGDKHVLVIIADFPDYPYTGMGHYSDAQYPTQADKAAAVSDDVFGSFSGVGNDSVNLAQQLYDCSFGKLSILPTPDHTWTGPSGETLNEAQLDAATKGKGVLYVSMTKNLDEYTTEDSIRNEMKALAEAKLPNGVILPGPFDHVIFVRDRCLEGINGGCGYAAYAAVNDWFQMFVERYVAYASIHVHEMGHNLNLAHSGSIGFSSNPDMTGDVFYDGTDSNGFVEYGDYTDHTCSMGNPLYEDDIGKMCFNAAKNFQIQGWYDDAKVTIDPAGFNGPPSYFWTGDILGVGEYDLRGANNWPVSIKVETGTPNDYFVGFNRAAGPNSQNDLADDMVTVIQTGQDGDGYSQSYLHMLLDATAEYSKFQILNFKKTTRGTGLPLTIKVNSIDTTSTPGSANVFIGYEDCTDMAPAYCGSTKDYPTCFNSNCHGQGSPNTKLDGCNHVPIDNCCGNEVCEPGETKDSCGFDCYIGPFDLVADECTDCFIKDGNMFDIEAKADGDLTVTGLDYLPYYRYTSTATYEVWAKAGTSPVAPNYVSGTNLGADGWTNVASVTACGIWRLCKITFSQSLQVPRGTYMGFAVFGLNGDDVMYYSQSSSTVLEDDFMRLHPARPFNYIDGAASEFSSVRTYNGVISYFADTTPPPPECVVDGDCNDGAFCNGSEICTAGTCKSGTAPCLAGERCNEVTDLCEEFKCDEAYFSKDSCNADPASRCFWGNLACTSTSKSGNTSRNKCCDGDGGGGGDDGGGGDGGGGECTAGGGNCSSSSDCCSLNCRKNGKKANTCS